MVCLDRASSGAVVKQGPRYTRAYVPTAVRDMNVGEMADLWKSAERAVRAFMSMRFRTTDENVETFVSCMGDLAEHVGIDRETL